MAKFTVSTKPNKSGAAQQTVLEVVDEGCPRETLVALATQTVVIRWQAWARKHGIPANASIKLADYVPGVRHASVQISPLERAKNDPAYKAELLAALTAMK